MRLDPTDARRRVTDAPVGRLATTRPGGGPHAVPVCFAVLDDCIYWAVDGKPKASPELQRLDNIAADAHVALLVDHYEDDWDALWWVRVDGQARVVTDEGERSRAVAALRDKYTQYATHALSDAVVAIDVTAWSSWAADPDTRRAPER